MSQDQKVTVSRTQGKEDSKIITEPTEADLDFQTRKLPFHADLLTNPLTF